MLVIIHGLFAASFAVLGIVFSLGKGAFLIAGYNTASQAEKNKTDEKALCRFMGKLMFLLAGCWLIVLSSAFFDKMYLLWVGLTVFFVVIVGGVVYANTGNRFKK